MVKPIDRRRCMKAMNLLTPFDSGAAFGLPATTAVPGEGRALAAFFAGAEARAAADADTLPGAGRALPALLPDARLNVFETDASLAGGRGAEGGVGVEAMNESYNGLVAKQSGNDGKSLVLGRHLRRNIRLGER